MADHRPELELEPPQAAMRSWPHVVIVGGGFAGIRAARRLAGRPVRVTLIDKRNFNLFQPMLYQVASGLVAESDIATPLRRLLRKAANVQVLLGEVVDLDPQAREVVLNDQRLHYDRLILAAGSGSSYFGHEEWRALAPPMKILEHAEEIRRRLLNALEAAEQCADPERRRVLQSVVVVGAGPSGCELAGALIALMRDVVRSQFRQLDADQCRVTLVDPGDRVLRAMPAPLSERTGRHLRERGVELLLGARVQRIEAGRLEVSLAPAGGATGTDGAAEPERRQLEAATICWTAGVRASHLGALLAERTGCPLDRGGRVVVQPDFSIPDHPEIRVVGDLCSYSHTADGRPLPGMAGPAGQMGGWVALDLLAGLRGAQQRPFRWFDFGSMAAVSPFFAVADLRGLQLWGPLGWLFWGLAHLAFMPDSENRLMLLVKWLWAIVTRQRSALLISGRPDQHIGVEVGLEEVELSRQPEAGPPEAGSAGWAAAISPLPPATAGTPPPAAG
jgi:NADH dehydrogenase